MRNLHVTLLALFLAAAGIGLCAYKVSAIGLPLQPDDTAQVWMVELRAVLTSDGDGPVRTELAVPKAPAGYAVLSENTVAHGFGVVDGQRGPNHTKVWTARRAGGRSVLYYRLQLARDEAAGKGQQEFPGYPAVPQYQEPFATATQDLLADVRQESADIESFARVLVNRYNKPDADERVALLQRGADKPLEHVHNLINILAGARIPARVVWVLPVREGLRDGRLAPWLQVHNEQRWITINPHSGAAGVPNEALAWYVGEQPLINAEGAQVDSIEFSATRGERSVLHIARQRAAVRDSKLMDFSLYSLPVNTQNVYRLLLVVPLGALLVVLLRNVIGIKTFGTFMPVLIAMAFRETHLAWGVALFCMVVAMGLLIRFYLERLKLLLVPRLASVLIIVVLLMTGISVISHRLGLDQALSIALFPMVIMAMTVERMSLVWDEHGPSEALQQGLGSLMVAALSYLIMTQQQLVYLFFTFPELHLVVLALTLLLGRYTGYRLSEIWRFRAALAGREGI